MMCVTYKFLGQAPVLHQTLSMPYLIIEISGLTQLVADNLLLDISRSLVSLTCTYRA